MPVIDGIKMACAPCIRGHRSTKCTHANERLMIPVKKPGRPLSICPHITGQSCGCSTVTAAIPRKQDCHCGSSAITPSVAQPQSVVSPPEDLASPTRPPFRVQKSTSSLRPHNRKQSVDPSAFDRIDKEHVNVLPFIPNTTQPLLGPAMPVLDTSMLPVMYGTNQFPNGDMSSLMLQDQYGAISGLPGPTNPGYISFNSKPMTTNGAYVQHVAFGPELLQAEVPPTTKSCCAPTTNTGNGIHTLAPTSLKRMESSGGCCGSSPAMNMIPKAEHGMFSSGIGMHQPAHNMHDPQQTVFEYPPSYGSFQHPLQPSEWRKSMMYSTYNQLPSAAQHALPNGHVLTPASSPAPSVNTYHTCGCGPGCQCIGCAAHPYNDATQDYVRSAYEMIQIGSRSATKGLSNGYSRKSSLPYASATNESPVDGSPVEGPSTDYPSGSATESPSDSGTAEEQNLSASDFFFVNYPFSFDGCGGDTNSCPCGDDCECVGCTIHRFDPLTALPLQPSPSHVAPVQPDGFDLQQFGAEIKHEILLDDAENGTNAPELEPPIPTPQGDKKKGGCCSRARAD